MFGELVSLGLLFVLVGLVLLYAAVSGGIGS